MIAVLLTILISIPSVLVLLLTHQIAGRALDKRSDRKFKEVRAHWDFPRPEDRVPPRPKS
jgi:hypothetical protein